MSIGDVVGLEVGRQDFHPSGTPRVSLFHRLGSELPGYCQTSLRDERRLRDFHSKLRVAGGAGEGDDVADVGHAGDELDDTLKAESEAGVRDRAVTT